MSSKYRRERWAGQGINYSKPGIAALIRKLFRSENDEREYLSNI